MIKHFKHFALIILSLFFCISANSETLDEVRMYTFDHSRKEFNAQNFPAMYNYFWSWAREIFYKYDPKYFPHPGSFTKCTFSIHKDGSVEFTSSPVDGFFKDKDREFLRTFIQKNPPPPFPKDMEDEKIQIDLDIVINPDYEYTYQHRVSVLSIDVLNIFKNYIIQQNNNSIEIRKSLAYDKDYLSISIYKNINLKNMTENKCKKLGYQWSAASAYCLVPINPYKEIIWHRYEYYPK